ncbi:MAG: serine hydrolase domain-containing protein [Verrucomicrobiota bacterium]
MMKISVGQNSEVIALNAVGFLRRLIPVIPEKFFALSLTHFSSIPGLRTLLFGALFTTFTVGTRANATDSVRSAVQDLVADTAIPGAVVAYRTAEGRTDTFAVGYADPETNRPMSPDLVFPVGSVAKPFVCALFLLLSDEGLVDRETTVGNFLSVPDFVSEKQIRSLGNHTARLPDAIRNADFQKMLVANPSDSWTAQEILPFAFEQTEPPEEASIARYSNTHTILLGQIIEEATKGNLSALLEEKVFTPFGMSETYLRLDGIDTRERPRGYRYAKQNWPIGYGDFLTDVTDFNVSWTNAAGSLFATADDLLRAVGPIATGSYLSEESKTYLFDWADTQTSAVVYGFGIESWNDWIGHRGDVPGYQAFFAIHNETETKIVVLTNLSNFPKGPGPAESVAETVLKVLH